jgi:hypothetical protein
MDKGDHSSYQRRNLQEQKNPLYAAESTNKNLGQKKFICTKRVERSQLKDQQEN